MALDNVQTTKWSALVELAAQEQSIAGQVANGLYQPDASNAKIVSVSTFSTPTIGDYTASDIAYEELTDGGLDITMDQKKYYAFRIEDVDRAQTEVDLESAPIQQAGRGLALTVDSYAFGLHASAGTQLDDGDFGGTPGNALGVNSGNVEEAIATIVESLDDNNAPADRVLVIPSFFNQKLVLAGIGRDLMTPASGEIIYREGYIGRYNGLDIFTSNKLASPATGEFYALAMSRRALPFAASVTESEVMRLESRFATAYRGLYVFGAGVLFSNEMVRLHVSKAAEA